MTVSATRGLTDATQLTPLARVREIFELTSLAKAHRRDGTGQERQRLTGPFPSVHRRELAHATRTTQ